MDSPMLSLRHSNALHSPYEYKLYLLYGQYLHHLYRYPLVFRSVVFSASPLVHLFNALICFLKLARY